MNNDLLEQLFKRNQEKINENKRDIDDVNENSFVSQYTYAFISCTLAEAQEFGVVPQQLRFITDARKSGEGAGTGTGLPAFYNSNTSSWVDFMGNAIVV